MDNPTLLPCYLYMGSIFSQAVLASYSLPDFSFPSYQKIRDFKSKWHNFLGDKKNGLIPFFEQCKMWNEKSGIMLVWTNFIKIQNSNFFPRYLL